MVIGYAMSSTCHPRLKESGSMLIAGKCFPKDNGVNITPNLQVALKMQSQFVCQWYDYALL